MSPPNPAPVTVVLTCFNHEAWIGAAVESVLNQTRPPARVVAVDDGSRDGSAGVLRRYEPQVRVIVQENAGVCVARNRGAADAATDFLMFLDGDDALHPRYIEKTLAALTAHPSVAFSYTPFRWTGAREGIHPSLPYRPELLPMGNTIANAALMRTAAFRQVGGFDLRWNRRGWEDWDLWLKFADAGLRGVLVDEPLLVVRAVAGAHRNRTAEADRTLSDEILAAHPGLLPRSRALWWLGKAFRRAWLAARAYGLG